MSGHILNIQQIIILQWIFYTGLAPFIQTSNNQRPVNKIPVSNFLQIQNSHKFCRQKQSLFESSLVESVSHSYFTLFERGAQRSSGDLRAKCYFCSTSVRTGGISSHRCNFSNYIHFFILRQKLTFIIIVANRYIFSSKLNHLLFFWSILSLFNLFCCTPLFSFTYFRLRHCCVFRPSAFINRNFRSSFVGLTVSVQTVAPFGESFSGKNL